VIALIVSSVSTEHLPVLHLGTAAMGLISGVLYCATLMGVDYTEFTQNNQATQMRGDTMERKPLIDVGSVSEAHKYGIDIDQDFRGNITVEPDSE